jgi:hypothetical protein
MVKVKVENKANCEGKKKEIENDFFIGENPVF